MKPFEIKPVELHFPDKPIQVEAQIKSADLKTFEIKPVEIRFPKEPVQFSAVPIEMRWPSQPVKVSVDLNNTGTKEERAIKGCDCKQPPNNGKGTLISSPGSPTPQESSSSAKSGEGSSGTWWTIILLFGEPILAGAFGGFAIAVVQTINKRREKFDQLTKIQAAYDEEQQREPSPLNPEGLKRFEEEKRQRLSNYEEQKRVLLESLFKKYEHDDPIWHEKKVPTEAYTTLRDLMPPRSERLPAMLLGIIAAMMLPGLLLFLPEGQLKVTIKDPFSIVRLWSLCLIAAMLGEPFIAFVLRKAREKMTSH